DDRRIEPDNVVTAGDHRPPPLPLDVLLELHAQRAVVPRRLRAAVDLARGIDEATPFGQVDYGIDDGRHGALHSLSGFRAMTGAGGRAPRAQSISHRNDPPCGL